MHSYDATVFLVSLGGTTPVMKSSSSSGRVTNRSCRVYSPSVA
jgi:hypothetical protein